MPKHTPPARFSKLVKQIGWTGSYEDLVDGLPFLLDHIAEAHTQEAMRRYYGGGKASQEVDPVTGKPLPQDSRFYQHLEKGRAILRSFLSFSEDDLNRLRNLMETR